MAEKTDTSGSNNRWWESYLVRYFLGFIVGAICVAVIASGLIPGSTSWMQGAGKALDTESKYGVTSTVIAIALLGLAYCYVASTPITVLHAGRFGKGSADRLARYFWLGWAMVLVVLLALSDANTQFSCAKEIYAVVCGVCVLGITFWTRKRWASKPNGAETKKDGTDKASKSIAADHLKSDYWVLVPFFAAIWSLTHAIPLWLGGHPQIADIRLFAIGMPVIWIGITQYFVLLRILENAQGCYDFYKLLFIAREKDGARDVRDTYSHLREHSNAIFIVAVEISMLALVLGVGRVNHTANVIATSSIDALTFWLCALCIWIVPTIFMWSRANAMERRFADNPGNFILEKTAATSHSVDADGQVKTGPKDLPPP